MEVVQDISTDVVCSMCGADWPVAPARPSLVGGCKGCRREYGRRYRIETGCNRTHYVQNIIKRRRDSLTNYHSKGRRYARYGITREQFEEMYRAQGGCCAICCKSVEEAKAHIDHDHSTGVVRGLLCSPCNRALGYLKDDIHIVQKALNYLTNRKAA